MRKIYCPAHGRDVAGRGHFRGNRHPQPLVERGRWPNRRERARDHQAATERTVQITATGADIRVRKNRQRLRITRGVVGKTGMKASESLAVH